MRSNNGDPVPGDDPLDLDAINRALSHLSTGYNATPDSEMGGLSPDTVYRLIHEPWGDEASIIRFNTNLRSEDFAGSKIFRRSRSLLTAVHSAGGFRTTPKGNLPRALVSRFLTDPEMTAGDELSFLKNQAAINEEDFFPLHVVKLICRCAGLLRQSKGRMTVTARCAPLLADREAGTLFAQLFKGCFKKFNLGYAYNRMFDTKSLQTCSGYTVFRLATEATEWRSLDSLYPEAFLPAVRRELEIETEKRLRRMPARAAADRIFAPLLDFGLLEGRYTEEFSLPRLEAVRTTSLYRKFFVFAET